MTVINEGTLKDGTKIVSMIPYATLFSDKTFLPACKKEIAERILPVKREEEVTLQNGIKTVRVFWELSYKQKQLLKLLQAGGRLVLLPRTVLDALNQDPKERMTEFFGCVGQKATEATANSKPHERVVDVNCWMY